MTSWFFAEAGGQPNMNDRKLSPLVTAVVRTYNRAVLVGRAIDSVLGQSFEDFELIVLDDCSSDNTPEVVQAYEKRDARVRYIRHERNMGTGRGFNTANGAARGKYVAYLDDDDVWRPDKLEKQVSKFESSPQTVGLLTGGIQYWNSDTGKRLRTWIPNQRGNVYWESLGQSGGLFGPPSVVMIRRSVIEDIGPFREDMPRGCCQQYYRRVAKKYEIDFVEDVLLDYYYHKQAITAITTPEDLRKCIVSMRIKIESTEQDLRQVPGIYATELGHLGRYQCLYGQMDEGYASFRRAAQVNGLSVPLAILMLGSKTRHRSTFKVAQWCSQKVGGMTKRLKRKTGR